MRTSETINEIAAALAKAQGAIEGAVKGKENPHFRSKYADLGAVWDACREQLAKNAIGVVQSVTHTAVDAPEGALRSFMLTRLVHGSGQWIEDGGVPLLLSKNDMQGLGSALTYSRRYGLMAMVGIAPEDDDGNAAVQSNGRTVEATPSKPTGFDKFMDSLADVAPEGTEALKKAWAGAPPNLRQYMAKHHNDQWESLKVKAAQSEQVPA